MPTIVPGTKINIKVEVEDDILEMQMARYKPIDTSPRFLAVDLQRQLLPGTFEHALNHLIDFELDLSSFDARFKNDETGAAAYPPAMLLKVVLFAYSQGIVSSRGIERVCRDHVTFIALSGDTQPHFTTIAGFVSNLADDIARVFTQILYLCDRRGLIGREMFAIDGVKLPSNASKQKSGTRADFKHQAAKLEAAARVMLERHREEDQKPVEADLRQKEAQRITRLQTDAARLRQWLAAHPEDRKGSKGAIRKSNRTDNESAKMATSKGVIQGYTGVAAVDAKHQIIVDAQAHGTGSEQELLVPVIKAIQNALADEQALITPTSLITADAGYHSEANLKQLAQLDVDALIADNGMRNAIRVSRIRTSTSRLPTPCTTNQATRKQRNRQPSIAPKTFSTTQTRIPASARRARRFTATAATASSMDSQPSSFRPRNRTACRANNETNVCAPRKRPRPGK
ncbi:transposase [Acidithiobacillus ferriphilus]|jgi:transposase|uniref:transposase n=1 Tax=Acidithiobacillus ferriphilus TaxID=1689834 RepID=UPI00232F5559|nr:transposase [Acidithiobacillus ferriphilus]WCE93129.1 transposase [Acidithiobacillus ferriphilus]